MTTGTAVLLGLGVLFLVFLWAIFGPEMAAGYRSLRRWWRRRGR